MQTEEAVEAIRLFRTLMANPEQIEFSHSVQIEPNSVKHSFEVGKYTYVVIVDHHGNWRHVEAFVDVDTLVPPPKSQQH